jgi:uncharacterized protein (DUF433 family)
MDACYTFSMTMNWREHIVSDPGILRGKPCIKGTRIPAALVLGYLAAGRDTGTIVREFPDLTASDVGACLDYARDLADFEALAA